MPKHVPPPTMTLRWCPECGQSYARENWGKQGHHLPLPFPGVPDRCPGEVRTLVYALDCTGAHDCLAMAHIEGCFAEAVR